MKFDLKTNIILALIIFALSFFVGYNIYNIQIAKMNEVQTKLGVEQKKNEICAQIKKIQIEVKKYKDNLPKGKDIPWIVSEITSLARQTNIEIHNIEPQSIVKKRFYAILPVTLRATASYHQLGRFLSKLESSRKFIKVDEIKIQSLPSRILEKQSMLESESEKSLDLFIGKKVLNSAGEVLADITFTVSTMYLIE